MAYLFGDHRLEKIGLAKVLHFDLLLTLNIGAAPTLLGLSAPLNAAIVDIVTADGAGTLLPAVTFASTAPTSATVPVIGLEIADGMFKGTVDQVLYAIGTVSKVTGASNITLGSPVYSVATYASAGVGVGFNIEFGMLGTGITQSLSANNGLLTVHMTVAYLDR